MDKKKQLLTALLFIVAIAAGLTSCSTADDDEDVISNELLAGIDLADDEDCCSLEEEQLTIKYLLGLHELTELGTLSDSIYTIRVYSKTAELKKGYNEIFFTVVKTRTGRHVKDVEISNITPLMTMGAMGGKQHSTPVGSIKKVANWIPVFKTWISFVMNSDAEKQNTWELAFSYDIQGRKGAFSGLPIEVGSYADGTELVKSFKHDNVAHFLTLASSIDLTTGSNEIVAYVNRQDTTDITKPYGLAEEEFRIGITPTMPDMGNHSSPDNEDLTQTENGAYEGTLNLTMTGLWNIHLVVYDSDGVVVAGSDNDSSGYSSIYWTIVI